MFRLHIIIMACADPIIDLLIKYDSSIKLEINRLIRLMKRQWKLDPNQTNECEQTRMTTGSIVCIHWSKLFVFDLTRLLSLDLRKDRLKCKIVDFYQQDERKKQNREEHKIKIKRTTTNSKLGEENMVLKKK